MINNPNESYFRKLVKGEISLAKTFWAWFILVTLILKLILGFNMDLHSLIQEDVNEFFTIFFYLLTLIYTIFIFFAVFRSASNYEGNKFWPFMAKLIVSFYVVFSLMNAINTFRLYYSKDFLVSTQINYYKENLPMQVDSFTKLIDIKKENKNIYYIYQLFKIDKDHYDYKLAKFKSEVQNTLCETPSSLDLIKNDYILNYKYIDKKKKEILNIVTTKKDCGEGIYDMDIIKELLKKGNY